MKKNIFFSIILILGFPIVFTKKGGAYPARPLLYTPVDSLHLSHLSNNQCEFFSNEMEFYSKEFFTSNIYDSCIKRVDFYEDYVPIQTNSNWQTKQNQIYMEIFTHFPLNWNSTRIGSKKQVGNNWSTLISQNTQNQSLAKTTNFNFKSKNNWNTLKIHCVSLKPNFPKIVQSPGQNFFEQKSDVKRSFFLHRKNIFIIINNKALALTKDPILVNLYIIYFNIITKKILPKFIELYKTKEKNEPKEKYLTLKFFCPLLNNDFVICCKENSCNIPIGTIGVVKKILPSCNAICEFNPKNFYFYNSTQKKIFTDLAFNVEGSGLIVTKHFLNQMHFNFFYL